MRIYPSQVLIPSWHSWRVTEISQIILILLDSRCPLLHFPPSLASYLSHRDLVQHKRIVLVLTKADIVGPARVEAWKSYLKHQYPHLAVVPVESYLPAGASATADGSAPSETARGKARHAPFIPSTFRHALVDALREAHASLLEPPEEIKGAPEKLQTWKSRVKKEIDWDRVMTAHGDKVGTVVGGAAAPHPRSASPIEGDDADDTEEEFLTVGLIGVYMSFMQQ